MPRPRQQQQQQTCCSTSGSCSTRAGVSYFLMLLLSCVWLASGASYEPHHNCSTGCDEQHNCVSTECGDFWDACPEGHVKIKEYETFDPGACYNTKCELGGCDEAHVEVASKPCVSPNCGVCFEEKCCKKRTTLHCCRQVPCTVTYGGQYSDHPVWLTSCLANILFGVLRELKRGTNICQRHRVGHQALCSGLRGL